MLQTATLVTVNLFIIVINSQQVKSKQCYSEINFKTRYELLDKQET